MNDIDRKVHEYYAKAFGYFWMPCPFPGCGRMFGGHETGEYNIKDKNDPNLSSMTCRLHDEFAHEMHKMRNPGVEYWSSDGRLHYRGDPEADMALHAMVTDFRKRLLQEYEQ